MAFNDVKRKTTDPYDPGALSRFGACLNRPSFTHAETDTFEAMVTGSSRRISSPEAETENRSHSQRRAVARLFFICSSVSHPGSEVQYAAKTSCAF